jgi:hypothetical protein
MARAVAVAAVVPPPAHLAQAVLARHPAVAAVVVVALAAA